MGIFSVLSGFVATMLRKQELRKIEKAIGVIEKQLKIAKIKICLYNYYILQFERYSEFLEDLRKNNKNNENDSIISGAQKEIDKYRASINKLFSTKIKRKSRRGICKDIPIDEKIIHLNIKINHLERKLEEKQKQSKIKKMQIQQTHDNDINNYSNDINNYNNDIDNDKYPLLLGKIKQA